MKDSKMPKLLILAAGVGSRMKGLSDTINKGLLPIAGKAIISHIIDNVEANQIVIAVGYKSEQIKDYCAVSHPEKNIVFVDVDNYDGPGSGPGYSMYCCKNHLREPFYLVTADSLLLSKLPEIDSNWVGISKVDDIENYATCSVLSNGLLEDFKNKDVNGYDWAFTGVLAVKDADLFWKRFEDYKIKNPDKEVELVGALYKPFYTQLYGKNIDWVDIGRKNLYDTIHHKTKGFAAYELKKINIEEHLYKVREKVIKICNKQRIKFKKQRANNFIGVVPEILHKDLENVFVYKFVEGKTLYELDDAELYKKFLDWCYLNVFNKIKEQEDNFKDLCIEFYKKKTLSRGLKYCSENNVVDKAVINGKKCLSLVESINNIDWVNFCSDSCPSLFHGDLNFGNVVYNDENKFILIDWREDFCGSIYGDIYYDLAKLYAGSVLNFFEASKDNLIMSESNQEITLQNCTTNSTAEFKRYFENWIIDNGYNLEKVKKISSLIFISMSPLHPSKFGKYLFYYGLLGLN